MERLWPKNGHTQPHQKIKPYICKPRRIKTREGLKGRHEPKHRRLMVHILRPDRIENRGDIDEVVHGRAVFTCPYHNCNLEKSYDLDNSNLGGEYIAVRFACGHMYSVRNDFKESHCLEG